MRGACKELVAIKTGRGIYGTHTEQYHCTYSICYQIHFTLLNMKNIDAFIMNSTKVQNPRRKSQVVLFAELKTPREYYEIPILHILQFEEFFHLLV